jgi:XTP/dITP diphosphohydrolase
MSSKHVLVLGTHNAKKLRELAALVDPAIFDLRTLDDFPQPLEVDETGTTFAENAALKATQQATHLGHWVLADDSGLEVDALDGAPGVYSSRFSGENATDESNNELLLSRLEGLPPSRRSASFVCQAVLADPQGEVRAGGEGKCRGLIRGQPAGSAGFGYDPLFEVVEYHQTFGELGAAVKSVLSHRARALRMIAPQLVRLVNSGAWS